MRVKKSMFPGIPHARGRGAETWISESGNFFNTACARARACARAYGMHAPYSS
jgi:hypothetical protein